jgi:AraC-like DNA-binding protein
MKGKIAEGFRKTVEGVFSQVMGGDTSLIQIIEANAASNSPIHQMYRRALAQEPVSPPSAPPACDALSKKRQLEMDEFELQIAMDERKQRLLMMASEAQMKAADAQMKVMGVQKMLMETYALLCPNQVMDDRARLLFKDNLLNIATQGTTPARAQLAIEDGAGPSGSPTVNLNKPITISTLAAELGYRFDSGQLQRIGKKAAAAFRDKYGESPSKHEQLVGQASIMVNSYTERDRKLLEGVIVAFINE